MSCSGHDSTKPGSHPLLRIGTARRALALRILCRSPDARDHQRSTSLWTTLAIGALAGRGTRLYQAHRSPGAAGIVGKGTARARRTPWLASSPQPGERDSRYPDWIHRDGAPPWPGRDVAHIGTYHPRG